jgi:pilus assembly protein FimV
MITHRRKLLPYCIAAALLSGPAAAVGLGEIQLTSYLGKPLTAEVALNSLGDLSADQIKVRIGGEADYQALGVDYTYLHSQLKLEPFVRDGRGYVRISTHEPISEPYLNFVLTLQWPQGRVVREFTVLLDPAPIAVAATAPGANPGVASTPAIAETAAPPARAHRRQRARAATATTLDGNTTGSYRVQRGDSLWRIAAKLRPANASLAQTMSAIVARNPQAFINGNPDRLKEAARITAPSAEQIAAASSGLPAVRETLTPANAVAATATNTEAVPQLAVENSALKAQVAELTGSVDALNHNLEQSEQRLHQLEAQLDSLLQQFQQQRATVAALSGNPSSSVAGQVTTATGSMINQVNASELSPAPVAHTPWWVHLIYWLGIGAAATWAIREHFWPQRKLALLGAIDDDRSVAAARARAPAAVAPVDSSWRAPVVDERESLAAVLEDIDLDATTPIELTTVADAGEVAPALERAAEDPVDASISAGVFLAFGRYDEAERLLREALMGAPERVDLKLQLLDVYLQADQAEHFDALAADIEQGPTTPEIIAELAVLRDAYRARH